MWKDNCVWQLLRVCSQPGINFCVFHSTIYNTCIYVHVHVHVYMHVLDSTEESTGESWIQTLQLTLFNIDMCTCVNVAQSSSSCFCPVHEQDAPVYFPAASALSSTILARAGTRYIAIDRERLIEAVLPRTRHYLDSWLVFS